MYKNNRIGVVIPAYNEEDLIGETLAGMPDYIDRLFVVNDGSADRTSEILAKQQTRDRRITIIDHESNLGLGKSLIDGYRTAMNSDVDLVAVMAGDNQMHPGDLPSLLDKIIEDGYDYVKGNRLLHRDIGTMPNYRLAGNAVLTILTKFATGYYRLMDPQCGYTVIRTSVLERIPIESIPCGFGYNASILCMLNIQGFRVADVEVAPVYGREKSKIKLWKYVPTTSWILIQLFVKRLWKRYVVRDFHPLVLFYLFGLANVLFILIPFTIRFFHMWGKYSELPKTTATIIIVTLLITTQSILFAVWMDMDYNKEQ